MNTLNYVVHSPMGTLRITFDEDGTKDTEGPQSAVTYLEMAMLGKYTPEGFALTMTTLTPDVLVSLESSTITVVKPFDELVREAIELEQ